MNKKTILFATLLFMAACQGNSDDGTTSTDAVDAIWFGGDILTMAGDAPEYAEAIGVKDGNIVSGEIDIDMSTINPTDENYSEDNPKEKLIDHLSGPDFFDVKNHSSANIAFAEVVDGVSNGNLTIRGITNSESIENIKFEEVDGTLSAKATMTFDRTKYDVSFVHPMEEMVVSNDIELTVELSGTPN